MQVGDTPIGDVTCMVLPEGDRSVFIYVATMVLHTIMPDIHNVVVVSGNYMNIEMSDNHK